MEVASRQVHIEEKSTLPCLLPSAVLWVLTAAVAAAGQESLSHSGCQVIPLQSRQDCHSESGFPFSDTCCKGKTSILTYAIGDAVQSQDLSSDWLQREAEKLATAAVPQQWRHPCAYYGLSLFYTEAGTGKLSCDWTRATSEKVSIGVFPFTG